MANEFSDETLGIQLVESLIRERLGEIDGLHFVFGDYGNVLQDQLPAIQYRRGELTTDESESSAFLISPVVYHYDFTFFINLFIKGGRNTFDKYHSEINGRLVKLVETTNTIRNCFFKRTEYREEDKDTSITAGEMEYCCSYRTSQATTDVSQYPLVEGISVRLF